MKLVRKVAEWNSGGEDEEQRREKDRPSEEDRRKAREHLQKYNPQVPGKVVYVYRFDLASLHEAVFSPTPPTSPIPLHS